VAFYSNGTPSVVYDYNVAGSRYLGQPFNSFIKAAAQISIVTSGSITNLGAFVKGVSPNSPTPGVTISLYTDASGAPNTLVGQTSGLVAKPSFGWVSGAVTSTAANSGTYWVVVESADFAEIATDAPSGSTVTTIKLQNAPGKQADWTNTTLWKDDSAWVGPLAVWAVV
jgi:hypothetical protein